MRNRWKLVAAASAATGAAATLAAVALAQPSITVTSLQARANGTSITSGPMGAGYDIRIVANVRETRWESTSWSIGGVVRCVNHEDESAGNDRTVTLEYEFEANATLKEGEFPSPGKVGPSEHVLPPPPGSASPLRVELYANDSCSGTALASRSVTLTTRTPGANEPLVAACQGMKVAVVLDESGSIASAGATQEVRDATRALAQGLVGTGAVMAVFKFSTRASSNYIAPYQEVTQSFTNGRLDDYLDDYDPEGATNWDAGLTQARDRTQSNRPDLVVFLTDGNPNRRGDGDNGYEEGAYWPMSDAADVADDIKENSHLFAIGVGQGVTDPLSGLRIQAVSGTRSFPENSIETADYTLVTDFTELEEALRDLASNLCNVTVTVTKETDEARRDAWVSRAGWGFSGRVLLQPPATQFGYRWYEPGQAGPPVNTVTATQSGYTQAGGTMRFVWRPTSASSRSQITISETIPAAYTANSVTCTSGAATIFTSEDPATVASFTLQGLAVRDQVHCVVRNRFKRSTVRVVKNWVGDPDSATIFVDSTGSPPFDASTDATSSGTSVSFDYPVSTGATVGETSVPAGYAATIQCGGGAPQAYGGGPFPVTAPAVEGATLTCTITNRQLRSTVQVVKQWDGAPSSATLFVDRTGSAPFDASTVATADGDSTSFTYPVGTAVTVGEVAVPAGYEATIHCGLSRDAPVPYFGGPFPVTAPPADGGTLTCTITNIQQFSTVRVVKNWVGAPSTATIFVDADGVAPFDASTLATANGDSTSFSYPLSTAVTVGETAVPAGYTATINCGQGAQAYAGGPFPVTSPAVGGATTTCVITNIQLLSRVRVVKNWSGAPATATIFVDADGVAPFDASTVATADGDSAVFTYPVSTGVFVGEDAVPGGYTATIQCGAAPPQAYGGGPFAVTSPATAGATLTCTISNNLIPPPATVRVVKDWDGAAASATIFVDADGIAPFDASTVATASGDSTSFEYVAGTPVTVGETAVPTGYAATIQCGDDPPQAYAGGPFAVTAPAAGATLTCTITNRQTLSTVRVVKNWIGTPSSAEIFVDADGVAPFDASAISTASGTTTFFTYPTSTPVFVGETTVPTGFAATISCGALQARQAYTGGPFPVTSPAVDGATTTCTITNTEQFSTVEIVKQWVGDPASATIFVDADGTAPFDASTVATAGGDSAAFTYQVSTPVTVGETAVPAGYAATIDCGGGPQAYGGGPFQVVAPEDGGATLTCTIVNTQQRSTVQVVKDWAGATSTATIFVDASGAPPFDASTVATASGQSAAFTYPVSTPVTVGEATVPAGFTATIDCGGGPQPYAGGPFAVTAPATDGATLTCTIVNTPRTTIRVVKNWVGRARSAAIFVDGNGRIPLDASAVASADGQSVSFDFPPSTSATLGELAVPLGYFAVINCGTGPQDLRRYAGGPFTVTSPAAPDGVLTCTVTNVRRLGPVARLLLTKTASRRVVRPSQQVGFRITIRNRGRGMARNVAVCDRMPRGLRVVRAQGARRSGRDVCWRLSSLRPGARRSFQLLTRVTSSYGGRTIVNPADVSGQNSINCRRQDATSRLPACRDQARLVLRAARALPARATFERPPFTG